MKAGNLKEFKPCSKCGFEVSKSESISIDCIYPLNREKTKWNCYCNQSIGGCGRTVYADTTDELQRKWNSGVTDEILD